MVCAMRAPPDQSMRSTRVGAAATPMERAKLVPLSKWPSSRVAEWCAAFNQQHCAAAARAAAAAAKDANAQPRHKQQQQSKAAAAAATRSPQSARRAESGPKPWIVKTKAATSPKPWHKPPPSTATSTSNESPGDSASSNGSISEVTSSETNPSPLVTGNEPSSTKADVLLESTPSCETTTPLQAPVPPSTVLPADAAPTNSQNASADTNPATTAAAAPAAEPDAGGPRLTYLKLPRHTDGKALVKLTALRLTSYCQGDAVLGQLVYDAVREELKATSDARDSKRRRWQELLYGQAQYLPRPGDPPAAAASSREPGEGGGGGVATIPEENAAASADT